MGSRKIEDQEGAVTDALGGDACSAGEGRNAEETSQEHSEVQAKADALQPASCPASKDTPGDNFPSPPQLVPSAPITSAHTTQPCPNTNSPSRVLPPPPPTPAGAEPEVATWQQQSTMSGQRQHKEPPLLVGVTAARLSDSSAKNDGVPEGWWGGPKPPARLPKVSRQQREKSYLLFCVGAANKGVLEVDGVPPGRSGLAEPRDQTEPLGGATWHSCDRPRQVNSVPLLKPCTVGGVSSQAGTSECNGPAKRQRLASVQMEQARPQPLLQCVPDMDQPMEDEEGKRQAVRETCDAAEKATDVPWTDINRSEWRKGKRSREEAQVALDSAVMPPPMRRCASQPLNPSPEKGSLLVQRPVACSGTRASAASAEAVPRTRLQMSTMLFGDGLLQGQRQASTPPAVSVRDGAMWRAAEEKVILEHENMELEARVARLESSLRKSLETVGRLETKILLHRGREMCLEEKVRQLENERDELRARLGSKGEER